MKTLPLFLFVFLFPSAIQADPFSFIAVGDIPYNPTAEIAFGRSIAEFGGSDASFAIHVGDIKARKESCGEETYVRRHDLYNRCRLPFVVLVGDNEFNDCPDPIEAIGFFRKYFCQGETSIGQTPMKLERQSKVAPSHPYPEHVFWMKKNIPFIGLNVVGSDNHYSATEEWKSRTEAGVDWLNRGFDLAEENESPAVVVAFHANPFGDGKGRTFADSFAPVMETLVTRSAAFEKPVLFIHGDSHYFRWDHPFPSRTRPGIQPNLARLEVFGNPNPHWVQVTIDSNDPDVFSVKPKYLREK